MKLYLKGERCFTEKCAIEKRNVPPGAHGRGRRRKTGAYGEQLRMKQRARRVYGVLERQFRNTFEKAEGLPGKTGENLLMMLERRLDTVVNGRKVNIPSYQVGLNDEISMKDKLKENAMVLQAREMSSRQSIPTWLQADQEALKIRMVSLPKREELTTPPISEQFIVELYSK
jgi:small subunit ribosomal protein S4